MANRPRPTARNPLGSLLLAALVGVLTLAAYAPAMQGPLVFDDLPNIELNPALKFDRWNWEALSRIFTDSLLRRRPLANLSFALNLFGGGDQAFRLHLTNVLIHLAASLLAFWLARRTWLLALAPTAGHTPPGASNRSLFVGFLVAAIFALHPVQTQAVSYVVQRMTSLATLFYLASLCAFVKGRLAPGVGRWGWFLASALCALGSLGSKEIGITLPLVAWLYDACFLRESHWLGAARQRGVALAVAAGLVVVVVAVAWWSRTLQYYQNRDFTPGQRLLTQARVVCQYLGLLVWPLPSRLNLLHDVTISRGLFQPPATAAAMGAVLAYLVLTVRMADRNRLVFFCLAWLPIQLALESTFLPLELMFEHRLYLPMFGAALWAAWAVDAAMVRTPEAARWGAALALCLVLCLLTHQRNLVWSDPLLLWNDVVAKSPNSARPLVNRAAVLVSRAQGSEAENDYRRATQLAPTDPETQLAWGSFQLQRGQMAEAEQAFSVVVENARNEGQRVPALRNRALARLQLGQRELALEDLTRAIGLSPGDDGNYYNRGNLLRAMGQVPAAIDDYRECLRLNEQHAAAHNNLAATLLETQDPQLRDAHAALGHARRAAELTGWTNWNTLDTLAAAYAATGDLPQATQWQARAIERAPAEQQPDLRARHAAYAAGLASPAKPN